MFALNKHHAKQPVPDWQFDVANGTTLSAPTADGLISKIVAYRLNNGLPPGNPEHEIALSIVVRWPHLVKEVDGTTEDTRLWSWVNRVWREVPKKTSEAAVIKPRAEACAKCSFSLAIAKSPELERRAYLIAAGDLRVDTQCAHHRWHNGVAILLSEPVTLARENPPACCWVGAHPPRSP